MVHDNYVQGGERKKHLYYLDSYQQNKEDNNKFMNKQHKQNINFILGRFYRNLDDMPQYITCSNISSIIGPNSHLEQIFKIWDLFQLVEGVQYNPEYKWKC